MSQIEVLAKLLDEAQVEKAEALKQAEDARSSLAALRVKQELELQQLAEQLIKAKVDAGMTAATALPSCCGLPSRLRFLLLAATVSYEKEGALSREKEQRRRLNDTLTETKMHATRAQRSSANMLQRLQAAQVEIASTQLEVEALQREAQLAKRQLYGTLPLHHRRQRPRFEDAHSSGNGDAADPHGARLPAPLVAATQEASNVATCRQRPTTPPPTTVAWSPLSPQSLARAVAATLPDPMDDVVPVVVDSLSLKPVAVVPVSICATRLQQLGKPSPRAWLQGRAIPQHYGDGGDVLALVVLQGCVVARPAWCACPEPPVEVAGDAGDRSASDIGSQRRARKLRLPMRRLRLPRSCRAWHGCCIRHLSVAAVCMCAFVVAYVVCNRASAPTAATEATRTRFGPYPAH